MNETLKKITDKLKEMGRMYFLEPATVEQIMNFEQKNLVTLPFQYREWLLFSDGGECFLPAGVQFYGVAHKPVIDVAEQDRPGENYIVIGALASGDPIVFEKGSQKIAIYNHYAGRIEEDEIYEDLFSFLVDLPEILGLGE